MNNHENREENYLALIDRSVWENLDQGCAYRGQDSPIETDKARLIRCLLYGKGGQFNSFKATGLY